MLPCFNQLHLQCFPPRKIAATSFTTRQCHHTRVQYTRQVTGACMVVYSYSSIERVYKCMWRRVYMRQVTGACMVAYNPFAWNRVYGTVYNDFCRAFTCFLFALTYLARRFHCFKIPLSAKTLPLPPPLSLQFLYLQLFQTPKPASSNQLPPTWPTQSKQSTRCKQHQRGERIKKLTFPRGWLSFVYANLLLSFFVPMLFVLDSDSGSSL